MQQRKAVLDALASKIDPDATVGEVLEAAEALGWSDSMGELSLADLADALLSDGTSEDEEIAVAPLDDDAAEAEEELEDEALEDDEDEALEEEIETHARTKKKAGKKTAKTAGKKKTAKTVGKKTTKKVGKKTAKTAGKKTAKKAAVATPTSKKKAKKGATGAKKAGAARMRVLRQKLEADEPMSLDEAAEVFLPLVERYDNATMQDLEEATGVGRRKLRFHIGQLVRHEYLERHGMGRGTYYTVVR